MKKILNSLSLIFLQYNLSSISHLLHFTYLVSVKRKKIYIKCTISKRLKIGSFLVLVLAVQNNGRYWRMYC